LKEKIRMKERLITTFISIIIAWFIWFGVYGMFAAFLPSIITMTKKCRYYARNGQCIQYEYGNHGKKFILKEIK